MVDVQHRSLRALEQDALAGPARGIETLPRDAGERQDLGRDGGELVEKRLLVRGRRGQAAQQCVVMHQHLIEPAGQLARLGQVA